jgi:hypothetical protein
MIQFLVNLKHKLSLLWAIIEKINGIMVGLIFASSVKSNLAKWISESPQADLSYRFLLESDLDALVGFFERQDQEQFKYFKPHGFDGKTLARLFRNSSFFMMGVFDGDRLAGYFFLRCFVNRKCFTGRIVDCEYQGRGISKVMGRILLRAAWDSGFRVFGTASKENVKSLGSYKSINDFKVIRELDNGYIYFEYLKNAEKPE